MNPSGEDDSGDDWEGLSEDEIEVFLSGTSDWGFETSEEEIDDVLYGKQRRPVTR